MHMARRRAARFVFAPLVLLATLIPVGAASGEIVVQIGTVEAAPGEVVALPVALHTNGEPLTVFLIDLLFDPQTLPLSSGTGRPDCRQNPELLPGELGTHIDWYDAGCPDGVECIRATALLSRETFPPGPTAVYTCAVQAMSDAASGSHAVRCSNLETAT